MHPVAACLSVLLLSAGTTLTLSAQTTPASISKPEATTAELPAATPEGTSQVSATPATDIGEEVPRVPGLTRLFHGFNAGLSFAQVHDSEAGWYNVVTPAVSYTFSRRYSIDASVSIYPYRLVEDEDQNPLAPKVLETHLGDVGDTLIGLHARFYPSWLRDSINGSFTIPTGDRSDGLSTGHVTFDISDHMEHTIKKAGLLLDLGGGDSSGLVNRMINRNEDSLGPLVHFQTGVVFYLPWSAQLQSVAYEQLPIGHQKLFNTVSNPGAPPEPVSSGSGVSEDNGFTTSLAIPICDHLTAGGYYNRSLREHLDTVSFGVTYVLRSAPGHKWMSMIDRALREAESGDK